MSLDRLISKYVKPNKWRAVAIGEAVVIVLLAANL